MHYVSNERAESEDVKKSARLGCNRLGARGICKRDQIMNFDTLNRK